MKRLSLLLLPLLWLAFGFKPAPPAHNAVTEILVVGTHYLPHDVLRQSRQKEVSLLVGSLARFHPDKILLDVPYHSGQEALINQNYQSYLKGLRPLDRSVEEQLGFRLASLLGLETFQGIHYEGGQNLSLGLMKSKEGLDFAEDAKVIEVAKKLHQENESFLRYIAYLNHPQNLAHEHSTYVKGLSRIGAGAGYQGATLLGEWYAHHMKLFSNLTQIASQPGERIVLFVDSSYAPILKELIDADPQYRWVPLEDYVQVK